MTYLEYVKEHGGIDLESEYESVNYQIMTMEAKNKVFNDYMKTKPTMDEYIDALMARGINKSNAVLQAIHIASRGFLKLPPNESGCLTPEYWKNYYPADAWPLCGITEHDLK